MPIGLPSRDLIAALGFGGILEDEAAKLRKSGLQANAQGEQSRAATPAGGPDDEIPMPYQRPRAPSASEPPPYLQMHGATPESLPMPMPTANAMASPQSGAGAPLMSIPPMGREMANIPSVTGLNDVALGLGGGSLPRPSMPQPNFMQKRNREMERRSLMPDAGREPMDGVGLERFLAGAGDLQGPLIDPGMIPQIQDSMRAANGLDFSGMDFGERIYDPTLTPEERDAQDFREVALNDYIMGGRQSGYSGAEGQRGRERAERGATALLGAGESAARNKRSETDLQLQTMRDEMAKYLDTQKTARANATNDRLERALANKISDSNWAKVRDVAKFDLSSRNSTLSALREQRAAVSAALAETTDDMAAARLQNELTTIGARLKEMSELPPPKIEAPETKGAKEAVAATEQEMTDAIKALGEELHGLDREEQILRIEKKLGKTIPPDLR